MSAVDAGHRASLLFEVYETSGFDGVVHFLQDERPDDLTELTAYLIGYLQEKR